MDQHLSHEEFIASRESPIAAAIERRLDKIREYEGYLRPDLPEDAREFVLHTLSCQRHLLSLELEMREQLGIMKTELARR